MTKKEKSVIVNFQNPEAKMILKVKNKQGDSVDTAIKIMKAFDEACNDIRKENEKKT